MAPLLVQEIDDEPDQGSNLELTEVEATLRRLLLDVAKYIDETPAPVDSATQVQLPDDLAKQKIVLRFTGGWVRDKLLGVPSHDIDVAINKMTGYQFGLRMKEYLEVSGNPEKYGLEGVATTDKQSQKAGTTNKSKTVGGLHKIEANPEKSKHLETVTTKIMGLDIDLVNLRKETYTDESRNPQMEFGSPEEDALRRDATVNAMFYNINTEQVEDFTGRGRDDLRDKIIRTPLEPYQTFRDDPLRVLRLIRFAPRLNFTIEEIVQQAMRQQDIKDALRRKISRERIGIEVEKMLKGPDPHEAMRLIFDLKLYETIFSDPTIDFERHYTPDTDDWRTNIDFLRDTLDAESALSTILVRDDEERYLSWQLSALVPYRDAPQPEADEPGRKAPPPIASSVAREGVKATNKICDLVTASVRHQSEISGIVDRLHQQKRRVDKKTDGEDVAARDVLGMAIRRWGSSWRSQVLYSMLVDVANDVQATATVERRYTTFVQHLQYLDILEAYSFKPLMDGKALAKALNTQPGPWMKDALDVVMAYQLRHPDKANAEDAIAEVQAQNQNGGELASSLVHHFLKLTIRPLFVKAQPTSVTDTGRKNTTTVLPKKITVESQDDSVNKPWKGEKDSYALDLLRWSVGALDERMIEGVWPLIIPPILTLIDDYDVKYKQLGAELATRVLETTPPALLAKTGLGEVFEEALMPCLTYLPTITSEEESIPLLDAVYPALLQLAKVRYLTRPISNSKDTSADLSRQRTKFLDTILRKGIIYGYTHCSNYPRIVSALFRHLIPLLETLFIESVKHLKFLLPMITETLSHPLASQQIDTLLNATRALQVSILSGWPRMAYHRGEVLKGLTMCWLHLQKNSDLNDSQHLQSELKETVQMLGAAVQGNADFTAECHTLVQTEPRLKGLFDGNLSSEGKNRMDKAKEDFSHYISTLPH